MISQFTIWNFSTIDMLAQYLYIFLSAFLIFFGIELLMRYVKADKKTRQDASHLIFLIIAFALIGYGFYCLPTIYSYFYDLDTRFQWSFQQMPVVLIFIPFGYVAENLMFKQKLKIRLLSIIGILVFIYITTVMFFELFGLVDPSIDVWTFIIPLFGFYAIYGLLGFIMMIKILFIQLKPQRVIRKKVVFTFVMAILALIAQEIGGQFREEPGINNMNPWYPFFRLVSLGFWVLLRYFLISIPSYSEFEWRSGLKELHVLHSESGLSIYSYNFPKVEIHKGKVEESGEARPSTDLIGGGITGIKSMLGEIAGDKGILKTIEIGNRKLILTHGKFVTCLLLCEMDLGVYHNIMAELVDEIEKKNPQLEKFDGDIKSIVIEPIMHEIFEN